MSRLLQTSVHVAAVTLEVTSGGEASVNNSFPQIQAPPSPESSGQRSQREKLGLCPTWLLSGWGGNG